MERTVKKTELYDVLKTITSILVVLGHAAIMYAPSAAIETSRDSVLMEGVSSYIYAFHMPLFILLSGCVFGYCIEKGKYQNRLQFVCKKVKKLLLPYYVFGICYVAPVVVGLQLTDLGFAEYVKEAILLSFNPRHLWYLLVLFWIFLLYILLKPLLYKGEKSLILAAVISILIFVFWERFPMEFQVRTSCIYQIFFFEGILINRYYEKLEKLLAKSPYMLVVLPVLLGGIFICNPNKTTADLYKCIGILMMFYWAWYLLQRRPELRTYAWYKKIRANTFGIYLFHPMIIYVLYYVMRESQIHPVLLGGVIFVISFILSLGLSEVIRKTPFKWILAE